MELADTITAINGLKAEIDALRPINAETEARIMQKFRLDWNYHSNNLEGNSLTFGETKTFLLHGITAEGKPLKDHLDIKGHNEAILLLDDVIKGNRPLTETFLREIHQLILHEPYTRKAKTADGTPTVKHIAIGQYKQTPNHVETATGEIFYFATPEETPAKMNDLMDWYATATGQATEHPVLIAAQFHYRFIRIHPFDDGNGRMARILMNLILIRYAYPPVIIKTQEKDQYFRALRTADGGDETFFVNYIGEQLLNSMRLYIRGAKGENIEELSDVDKEIALLKAELNDAAHRVIYTDRTAKSIANENINPLLNMIFSKLKQFNELFNSNSIYLQVDYVGMKPNKWSGINAEIIPGIVVDQMSSYTVASFGLSYFLEEFIKTESKNFDITIRFSMLLNRYDFDINLAFGENKSFKIFYHEKNAEKKFEEIANLIAKHVLAEIKAKLAA